MRTLDGTCEVGFEVRDWMTGISIKSGSLTFESQRPPLHGGSFSQRSLRIETEIERDAELDGVHLLRLLVWNQEAHDLLLFATNRSLSCVGRSDVQWALHQSVIQGEDIGPINVKAGEWGVFVHALRSAPDKTITGCRVSVEISGFDPDGGLRIVDSYEAELKREGKMSRPTVERPIVPR
jgi:hypothetical protein